MSDQPQIQTILPESKRAEIGPLEEETPPIDPVFAEWWNNRCRADDLDAQGVTYLLASRAIAYFAWQARDAEIRELEADLEHFRKSAATLRAHREDLIDRCAKALDIAREWIPRNTKHKPWIIDQVVRALTGTRYDAFVARAKSGEGGPETYTWDCGVAPREGFSK